MEEGGSRGGCETSVKGGTLEKEKRKAFQVWLYATEFLTNNAKVRMMMVYLGSLGRVLDAAGPSDSL